MDLSYKISVIEQLYEVKFLTEKMTFFYLLMALYILLTKLAIRKYVNVLG